MQHRLVFGHKNVNFGHVFTPVAQSEMEEDEERFKKGESAVG